MSREPESSEYEKELEGLLLQSRAQELGCEATRDSCIDAEVSRVMEGYDKIHDEEGEVVYGLMSLR